MENKTFQHSIQTRVRYSETDKMGYCYYGNYATFCEIGRVEALRSLGISYKELEDNGVMLPVKNFTIDYNSPAYYDDELSIITSITAIKGARILFDYQIFRNQNTLVAQAHTTLVFVDSSSMRPIPAPENILSVWNSL